MSLSLCVCIGESDISHSLVSSILSQSSVSADDGLEFVGHVFKTLSSYIGAQWSESIDKLASAMNQAKILYIYMYTLYIYTCIYICIYICVYIYNISNKYCIRQGKEIAAKETGEAFKHMLKTDRYKYVCMHVYVHVC